MPLKNIRHFKGFILRLLLISVSKVLPVWCLYHFSSTLALKYQSIGLAFGTLESLIKIWTVEKNRLVRQKAVKLAVIIGSWKWYQSHFAMMGVLRSDNHLQKNNCDAGVEIINWLVSGRMIVRPTILQSLSNFWYHFRFRGVVHSQFYAQSRVVVLNKHIAIFCNEIVSAFVNL